MGWWKLALTVASSGSPALNKKQSGPIRETRLARVPARHWISLSGSQRFTPLWGREDDPSLLSFENHSPPFGGLAIAYSNSGILSNPISGSGVLPLPNLDALSLSSRAERGNLVGVAKAFQQHGSAEGAVPAAIARDSRSRETPCLSTLTPSSHPPRISAPRNEENGRGCAYPNPLPNNSTNRPDFFAFHLSAQIAGQRQNDMFPPAHQC